MIIIKKIYSQLIFTLIISLSITNFSYTGSFLSKYFHKPSKEKLEQYRRKEAKGYVTNAIRFYYKKFFKKNESRLENNTKQLDDLLNILTITLKDGWEALRYTNPSIRINFFIILYSSLLLKCTPYTECLKCTLYDYRYHSSKKANLNKRLERNKNAHQYLPNPLIGIERTIQGIFNPGDFIGVKNIKIEIEEYNPESEEFIELITISFFPQSEDEPTE